MFHFCLAGKECGGPAQDRLQFRRVLPSRVMRGWVYRQKAGLVEKQLTRYCVALLHLWGKMDCFRGKPCSRDVIEGRAQLLDMREVALVEDLDIRSRIAESIISRKRLAVAIFLIKYPLDQCVFFHHSETVGTQTGTLKNGEDIERQIRSYARHHSDAFWFAPETRARHRIERVSAKAAKPLAGLTGSGVVDGDLA